MTRMPEDYTRRGDELLRRIRLLAVEHPEVLKLKSAWDLFEVPGFDCKDLDVSLAQAAAALGEAKRLGPLKETR